ncbi:MAG: hypothetical protein U0892_17725 [Pirellulales bacterium]
MMQRRKFVGLAAGTAAAGWLAPFTSLAADPISQVDTHRVSDLHLAPFRFDVTPPLGHGCCGNWIKPIEGYDDAQECVGFVLTGAGKPIVVCAVDWTGLLNEAHVTWRTAMAEAAGTTPDRVAVQVVHQHNAPFACLEAAKLVADQGDLPSMLDVDFFHRCLDAARLAVSQAMHQGERVTHIGRGQAMVSEVAANRRIIGENGKVRASRGSSCADPALRALPEGLIDTYLKTVAFFAGDRKLAACHYYACHPMSYYGDGRASADFCGLARKRRQGDEPGCTHIYFNGCGGNIGAGKYNDGSKAMRPVLAQRIYDGIVRADADLKREPLESVSWKTCNILPPTDPRWDEEKILKQIADKNAKIVDRSRPAYTVAWMRRAAKGTPIVLSSLEINDVSMMHLPAECFVEYQLRTQQMRPDTFSAIAAYGDGGPWYIPTAAAYPELGYEVSVAWCAPQVDDVLTGAIKKLIA